jgi:hypothetical protein
MAYLWCNAALWSRRNRVSLFGRKCLTREGSALSRGRVCGLKCVHQIQMSPSLPFTNVTPRWLGSGGGRARSPSTAQRPTGDRLTGDRNRTGCLPSERALAWLL